MHVHGCTVHHGARDSRGGCRCPTRPVPCQVLDDARAKLLAYGAPVVMVFHRLRDLGVGALDASDHEFDIDTPTKVEGESDDDDYAPPAHRVSGPAAGGASTAADGQRADGQVLRREVSPELLRPLNRTMLDGYIQKMRKPDGASVYTRPSDVPADDDDRVGGGSRAQLSQRSGDGGDDDTGGGRGAVTSALTVPGRGPVLASTAIISSAVAPVRQGGAAIAAAMTAELEGTRRIVVKGRVVEAHLTPGMHGVIRSHTHTHIHIHKGASAPSVRACARSQRPRGAGRGVCADGCSNPSCSRGVHIDRWVRQSPGPQDGQQ